jgi:hypothetical protein
MYMQDFRVQERAGAKNLLIRRHLIYSSDDIYETLYMAI